MANTLGLLNPFRYRGYVYDEETGLYYLQNRYYNPTWGRFINADAKILCDFTLWEAKLFTYCANNPVRFEDTNGQSFWDTLKKVAEAALGVAAVAFVAAVVIGTGGGAGFALAGGGALAGATAASTLASAAVVTGAAGTTTYLLAEAGSKVTSPGKMQEQVKRGQAPNDVKRVDPSHTGDLGEPHVHFKDGTALNQSGTVHDKVHGIPKLTRQVRKWLRTNNWVDYIK